VSVRIGFHDGDHTRRAIAGFRGEVLRRCGGSWT
jgi:hypothetical protein